MKHTLYYKILAATLFFVDLAIDNVQRIHFTYIVKES